MSYFAQNATEESLKEVARQMKNDNLLATLRDLYAIGAISHAEYEKQLRNLFKVIQ